MAGFHPDLWRARFLPRGMGNRLVVGLARRLPRQRVHVPDGFTLTERRLPSGPRVLYLRPESAPRAAMLYIHSGGYVLGSPELEQEVWLRFARKLNLAVLAVDYRLSPEHPYPAALDDCLAAFEFMHRDARALGIDPTRIIVAGTSAGGGLAAALTLVVHDRGRPAPLLQHLTYPMLDDRSTSPSHERAYHRLWDRRSNYFGWRSYLGREPAAADVPEYAAPARRRDLHGLPPAWLGVGTLDLFYEEDVRYAERLREAGVAAELTTVEGAFHGFDLALARAEVSRAFVEAQLAALRRVL